jgi:hypothetical protein
VYIKKRNLFFEMPFAPDTNVQPLTAVHPIGRQIWLYPLQPGQVATTIETRGGAEQTTKPINIVAHVYKIDGAAARLYIPHHLIKSTLTKLKKLPAYSYISDEDIERAPVLSLVAQPGESLILDVAIRNLFIPIDQQIALQYLSMLRPYGTAAPGQANLSVCLSYWLNVISEAGVVFHQAVQAWASDRDYRFSGPEDYANVLHKGAPMPAFAPLDAREAELPGHGIAG